MKILGFNISRDVKNKPKTKQQRKQVSQPASAVNKKDTTVPAGRVSSPGNIYEQGSLIGLKDSLKLIKPDYAIEAIPIIRKLYKTNEDVGSVLYDAIQLTNTGHTIKFDQSVKPELADEMRAHLAKVSKTWHTGTAGIDGLVNKWIAQIYVSGALSVEWIPNNSLTGIVQNALINPETIRFAIKQSGEYHPYQKASYLYSVKDDYIKLNTSTYLYYGLFSDEDTPYGIPPFLAALQALATQKDMKQNIHHILNQLGLLGYLEVTLDKPDQAANENETQYQNKLSKLLSDTKRNIIQGFKEGVVVGYQEDHKFEFHSTTKNLTGVQELFNMNENQIANGLKTSPSFLGVSSGSTESFLSIVFTKTLSQLKNVQQILASSLEKGYELELQLAGYNYKSLKVEFRASTVTDDLKIQQGREIKQRVLRNLWIDGIISPETYADEMGYQKPARKVKPPLPGAQAGPGGNSSGDTPEGKKKRKDDKNKSARKTRDKVKPQPKRKDSSSKSQ